MSVINYYGSPAMCVCACGCRYESRWKVRRNKRGIWRINTERECPECFRNWRCLRTTADRDDWSIESPADCTAAAAQSIHRAIEIECEMDCAT